MDSSSARLHHVARQPERADEGQRKKVSASGRERPDGNGQLSKDHDAQDDGQHVPGATSRQIEVIKGRFSLRDGPNDARERTQCDEGQHAVHDRSLEKPNPQTGDEARTEHALDGGYREAHELGQGKGILQFSQRSVCITKRSVSHVWQAIGSGPSNGQRLERHVDRRHQGG